MDRERKKRIQTIRLIITEVIMVVTVVVAVVILTFIAMGYNVRNGELDQSGLVQIQSKPSGAVVQIDGEVMSARTGMSKMLTAGEHRVQISKKDYDTWENDIISKSGWLLRLDYPRLFYQNRTPEVLQEYPSDIEIFSTSPNREKIIYAISSVKEWKILSIRGDNAEEKTIDIADLLAQHEILSLKWSDNSDKILIKTAKDNNIEWIIVNTREPEKSVNLSQAFGMRFSEMDFANDIGERMLAVENGNLRSLMVNDKTVSQALASNVETFVLNGKDVVYLTNGHEIKLYQDGPDDILLSSYPLEQNIKISIGEYLSEKYLFVVSDRKIVAYKGDFPTKDDSLAEMEVALDTELPFSPEIIQTYTGNELFLMSSGKNIAVFDAELAKLSQYEIEDDKYFFLDGYMIATIGDGKMIVRDFDGTNRREITDATGGGTISRDDKYLYYYKTERGNTTILREKIIE
ncbi:PEGA domain-containing protein [Candidatus Saccharibacteria bacterium]|nr:PEGA domain-containing protein [Candidatus Saccharibacteria bacterium]